KTGLAHYALAEQASGDLHPSRLRSQRLGIDVIRFVLQVAGAGVGAKVVRKRNALSAQRAQFFAAFGDELVFVQRQRGFDFVHVGVLAPSPAGRGAEVRVRGFRSASSRTGPSSGASRRNNSSA